MASVEGVHYEFGSLFESEEFWSWGVPIGFMVTERAG